MVNLVALTLVRMWENENLDMAEGSVDFPAGSDGKRIRLQCGRPLLGRSSGEENGYPLQYSCLENSKNRGAWQAIVHGVTKSQT